MTTVDRTEQIRKDITKAFARLMEDLSPEQQAELVEALRSQQPSAKVSQGGLHEDDFQWAVENASPGYVLTKFELSSDGYHWEAAYASLEQLEKEGRLA